MYSHVENQEIKIPAELVVLTKKYNIEMLGCSIYFDATGLTCPIPRLVSKQILEIDFDTDVKLVVKTTDDSLELDYLVMCDELNCKLSLIEHLDGFNIYTIDKPVNSVIST